MNSYEGVFIFRAELGKDELETALEDVKGIITKYKGEVSEVQTWGKRKLTFPIKKQPEGVYYIIDFQVAPEIVKKIEGIYKINDTLLRTLIVRKDS